MNVCNFAEEFTRLVIRHTKPCSPNGNSSANAPLNSQEVRNAVYNVLATIFKTSNDDDSFVKTPANGIAVITPTTPIIPKTDREQNDESASRSESAVINDEFVTSRQINEDNSFETLQDGKKFISRSNPAIFVSSLGRSDTFTRDENQETTKQDTTFDDVFTNMEVSESFARSYNEIREAAMNVVKKLDTLKKKTCQPTMPARRLSSHNGFSSHNRATSTTGKRAIPPMRRSVTAIPGTPPSSRSLATEKRDMLDRRKSISGTPCGTSRKLNESVTLGRTPSKSNVSVSSKTSPTSVARPTKNPKYAHVQSTIPKQIKRKAQ